MNAASIYNPFSVLNYFSQNGNFSNFWYATGTPTFLVKMCQEKGLYELQNVALSHLDLSAFDIERLQILPILFQTGYLTLKGKSDYLDLYQLDYPNLEVRSACTESLLEMYSHSDEPMH